MARLMQDLLQALLLSNAHPLGSMLPIRARHGFFVFALWPAAVQRLNQTVRDEDGGSHQSRRYLQVWQVEQVVLQARSFALHLREKHSVTPNSGVLQAHLSKFSQGQRLGCMR